MTYQRTSIMASANDLPHTAEVVIVGGGIVGIATAFFLKRQGVGAIVLDADGDIGTRTTAMSAHCIRAQFGEPDNIRMMAESLDFYEHFAERCGLKKWSIDLQQQGYLFASTDPNDHEDFAKRVDQQAAAGLDDVELLNGQEVRQRYPWLSQDIAVATYRARDGWIDSRKAVKGMAEASTVPIFLNTRVMEIAVVNGRVTGVRTESGTIQTSTVVLAAGPFSRDLSPEPLPLELWRRHRVILPPHAGIPQDGPVTIDANTGAHWRPHLGGALVAWARPESDGPAAWPVVPDSAFIDLVLHSEDGIGRIAPFWRELSRVVNNDDLLLTAGQYTVTPDHRPLIGPAPETQGLFLHTGYSGHGIMGAPAGARLLADLMTTSNRHEFNSFSPTRFRGMVAAPDVEKVVI